MKTAFLDCFCGISGDMTIGALLDAGLPLDLLREKLSLLKVDGYRISAEKVQRNHIGATSFIVETNESGHVHRSFKDIRSIIEGADGLSVSARETALKIFQLIAEAEGHVHQQPPEDVTFHEVGALDSIIDIVGCAIGLDELGIDRVYSSALPIGRGFVETRHGKLPLPAPATAQLLRGMPTIASPESFETVTPTGAAIVAALAEDFIEFPAFTLEDVGYGAGTYTAQHSPNMLRIIIGRKHRELADELVIEANIDDMNPEIFDYLIEKLLAAGAGDVFLRTVQMKKNRPGVEVVILTNNRKRPALLDVLFAETTTIGVRYYPVMRQTLSRRIDEVLTEFGTVKIKVASTGGDELNIAPEYEDCKRLAATSGKPLKEIYQAALFAYRAGKR
jgi:pyridinium-3,5-bisthiocarboxylic acid mononucleotide nickel chelatase